MVNCILESEIDWCSPEARQDQIYKLRVRDLAPTQFAVGKAEVQVRATRMRNKHRKNPQKLHDYLRVRPVPIVIRGKTYHLVDHHHLVRALHDALDKELGKNLCVYVTVVANFTGVEEVYFWKTMHKRNWVYLFDEFGGGPRRPSDLPAHVKDLRHDPYRSVAWIVRDRHGYLKNEAPFSEFTWANFFRTRILLNDDILAGGHDFDDTAFSVDKNGKLVLSDDAEEVIHDAMSLAFSPLASGLPGHRGG